MFTFILLEASATTKSLALLQMGVTAGDACKSIAEEFARALEMHGAMSVALHHVMSMTLDNRTLDRLSDTDRTEESPVVLVQ